MGSLPNDPLLSGNQTSSQYEPEEPYGPEEDENAGELPPDYHLTEEEQPRHRKIPTEDMGVAVNSFNPPSESPNDDSDIYGSANSDVLDLITTRPSSESSFNFSNTTHPEIGVKASPHLTSREVTILLGTLIPAIIIILLLTIALICALSRLHKRTSSRVGLDTENKAVSNCENGSSRRMNGQAHRPASRNSDLNRNGTTNGVLRAWEDNEVSNRRELSNQ